MRVKLIVTEQRCEIHTCILELENIVNRYIYSIEVPEEFNIEEQEQTDTEETVDNSECSNQLKKLSLTIKLKTNA